LYFDDYDKVNEIKMIFPPLQSHL